MLLTVERKMFFTTDESFYCELTSAWSYSSPWEVRSECEQWFLSALRSIFYTKSLFPFPSHCTDLTCFPATSYWGERGIVKHLTNHCAEAKIIIIEKHFYININYFYLKLFSLMNQFLFPKPFLKALSRTQTFLSHSIWKKKFALG